MKSVCWFCFDKKRLKTQRNFPCAEGLAARNIIHECQKFVMNYIQNKQKFGWSQQFQLDFENKSNTHQLNFGQFKEPLITAVTLKYHILPKSVRIANKCYKNTEQKQFFYFPTCESKFFDNIITVYWNVIRNIYWGRKRFNNFDQ